MHFITSLAIIMMCYVCSMLILWLCGQLRTRDKLTAVTQIGTTKGNTLRIIVQTARIHCARLSVNIACLLPFRKTDKYIYRYRNIEDVI